MQYYEADARIPIDELEEALAVTLRSQEDEEDDYDTLGGLIFMRLGRVPARGEMISVESVGRLEVIDADPRRIRKVRIQLRRRQA